MKNNKYLKKCLLQCLIIIIIFMSLYVIINNIEYNKYKKNFNYKLNAILELVKEKYPSIENEEIINILNSSDTKLEVLKEFGYDISKDSYILKNDKDNNIFSLLKIIILILMISALIYIFIKYNFKYDKQIDKIIETIEEINRKNYELDLDELTEGKLSILKSLIYKTTIMLKESSENSIKDKINIKNSLQDISHQIKTPLTTINILLDNIIDDVNMDSNTKELFIIQIKREITNITFLVESILKLSKFEVNAINFIRKDVKLDIIISEAIKNVSNLCDLKNINIKIFSSTKSKIYCDYRWQVEALTNILKNAIEHSYDNSSIIIECTDNKLYTQIKIKDQGKGIDRSDLSNIFKRFYKGKGSSKDSVGIGLPLAKAIIEKDNGKVFVESKLNVGTIFTIKYLKE